MFTPRRWIHQFSGAMVIAAEERMTYLHGRQAGRQGGSPNGHTTTTAAKTECLRNRSYVL
jgi:hypothetical protein